MLKVVCEHCVMVEEFWGAHHAARMLPLRYRDLDFNIYGEVRWKDEPMNAAPSVWSREITGVGDMTLGK